MALKDWKKDRDEPENMTWWGSGFGLRRSYIQVTKENNNWIVNSYKGQGHFEDAKKLPEKTFKTKQQALKFAKAYMRKN